MGLSEWLLVLPRERDWDTYYLPIINSLTAPDKIWHYKLRTKPDATEGHYSGYPKDNEWVYLAWHGIIEGRLNIHSVDIEAVSGYPVTSEGPSQGVGYYINLIGPFRTTDFTETDGTLRKCEVTNVPWGMPDLRRFEY